METLNQQLESSNNSNLIMNEQQNLLRERLSEEERKNFQLHQYIQQLQQQKSSLMTQLAVSTSNSSNLSNKQHSQSNQNNVSNFRNVSKMTILFFGLKVV